MCLLLLSDAHGTVLLVQATSLADNLCDSDHLLKKVFIRSFVSHLNNNAEKL